MDDRSSSIVQREEGGPITDPTEAPGTELDIGHSILEPDQIHMAEKDYNHYPSGYTFSICHAYHPLSHELEIGRNITISTRMT
jgi:hypothetical protein